MAEWRPDCLPAVPLRVRKRSSTVIFPEFGNSENHSKRFGLLSLGCPRSGQLQNGGGNEEIVWLLRAWRGFSLGGQYFTGHAVRLEKEVSVKMGA
jgi:hypothetical protein